MSRMFTARKGTAIEKIKINYLLSDHILRKKENYKTAWHAMFKDGFEDVRTHCSIISNSLSNTKYKALRYVQIPSLPADDGTCHLAIPAIAFLITKLHKTFDTKLEKSSQRSLNGSHSKVWVRHLKDLQQQVVDKKKTIPYSFMNTKHKYHPITCRALHDLDLLLDASAGSGNLDNMSEYIDASCENGDNGSVRR